MSKLLRNIVAFALVLLTLSTSIGIKMYIHECLTCNITDISLVDEVSVCHEHHQIHHINHNHASTCCENECTNNINDGCCSSHQAFIIYQFDYAPERNVALNFHPITVAEIFLHPDVFSEFFPVANSPFSYNYTNPPPKICHGIDLLRAIHQLKFDCCFLS